jgi:hypothetical protein
MFHQSVDSDFDSSGYAYAPNATSGTNRTRERALWCAVIEQAFVDMAWDGKSRARIWERDEAKHFLLRDRQSFSQICEFAGINPDIIRKAARQMEDGLLAVYVRPTCGRAHRRTSIFFRPTAESSSGVSHDPQLPRHQTGKSSS